MELNLLFKCITGSQSYGTNTENSDVDIKGVYIQSNDDVLGLNYKDLVSVTDDEVYYEIRRYVDLLSSANPSVLEMLFVEDRFVLYCHPSFQILRDNRHSFLTKKCKDSFGGMAVQQIKKAKGTDKNTIDVKVIVQRLSDNKYFEFTCYKTSYFYGGYYEDVANEVTEKLGIYYG